MSEMLNVVHRLSAPSLRTDTRHSEKVSDMMRNTTNDLALVTPQVHDLGAIIVLENHEDFTELTGECGMHSHAGAM